ncbi:34303_t:CDS:2, partial [Racocetra persica]
MRIQLIIIFLALFGLSASDELNCTDITSNLFEPLQPLQPSNGSVTRCYNLKLTEITLTPDGLMHLVKTVNEQYPAPIIQANYGDILILNVTNELGEPST